MNLKLKVMKIKQNQMMKKMMMMKMKKIMMKMKKMMIVIIIQFYNHMGEVMQYGFYKIQFGKYQN
eukprot:CAMPEP_0174826050 /NCGR_PEP_ID=MMETSP1107-20130205/43452_1 /TAXON_ID=36770 /ORGANISM="Paraphysomonas vestita, Strain GFlagA" /LENGTH=64 /DNA_ID=CAMNT_0016058433 /DNA_START=1027 /DNA_END=1221 /DNA_ORIENTATION=-